jgi:hypothetical protein
MTKLPIFLVLLLGLNGILTAQNYYTIQIGTFLDAQKEDFTAIQPLGFVQGVRTGANLQVIYVGGFENRAAAEKVWQQVRSKGYINAFIQERIPTEGQTVTMIQLATRSNSKPINWEEYANAGELFASISGDNVKILTGTYPGVDAAKPALAALKKAGFKDAFIKNVNTIFLHKLSEFETDLKKPLIPLTLNNSQPPAITQETPPTSYDQRNTPSVYDNIFQPKSPTATVNNSTTAMAQKVAAAPAAPRIRSNVKRTSALDLQKVLKAEGYYKGSLDGYYGAGTASSYAAILKGSRELQKYALLAQNTSVTGMAVAATQLQTAINDLPTDASAIAVIRASKAPIAKAYQAYYTYVTSGAGASVNTLMNAAIKEAFTGKKLPSPTPFDYRATYAYNDLEQLLLHLHYLHSLPDNDLAAPCWISSRHPKEMKAVFERYVATASMEYPLKACDQFLNWDEVKLLHTIAMDLNPSKKINTEELTNAAALRTMLYFAPKALSAADIKDTETWSGKLMTGLNTWSTTDPSNKQTVTAFKAAFYQSQVRLEDYFLDKGFTTAAAKSLALVTLRTLVEYHLERFI